MSVFSKSLAHHSFGYCNSTFNSVLRDAQQINLLSFDAISWSRVMDEFHKKETMYKHSFLNPCFSQWWICFKINFEGESSNHSFLWNGVIYELKQKVNCLCFVKKKVDRGYNVSHQNSKVFGWLNIRLISMLHLMALFFHLISLTFFFF